MGKTVLVIDDDREVRAAIRQVLADENVVVIEATNGAEALNVLSIIRGIDLILLDQVMPVMTGGEFLDRFEAIGQRQSRVIVMTAMKDPIPEHEQYPLLRKPFDIDQLLNIVRAE